MIEETIDDLGIDRRAVQPTELLPSRILSHPALEHGSSAVECRMLERNGSYQGDQIVNNANAMQIAGYVCLQAREENGDVELEMRDMKHVLNVIFKFGGRTEKAVGAFLNGSETRCRNADKGQRQPFAQCCFC